jgi:hypothetical protein
MGAASTVVPDSRGCTRLQRRYPNDPQFFEFPQALSAGQRVEDLEAELPGCQLDVVITQDVMGRRDPEQATARSGAP